MSGKRASLLAVTLLFAAAMAGCKEDTPTGAMGAGLPINPNLLPPGKYTQSALSIPAAIDDELYSTAAPWATAAVSPLTYLWSHQELNLFPLYASLTLPADEIVVAVIDTGVDRDHEDLAGRLWVNPNEGRDELYANGLDNDSNGYVNDFLGWNFVTDMNNPADDNGHGTHVAGTIAAIGNNAKGIVGVAPWVRIMALKVCSGGGTCSSSDIRAAIKYAYTHGAKIINLSLGGVDRGSDSIAFDKAIADATAAGALVFAASGNSAIDASHMTPANATFAVAVAAHRSDGLICSFSDYGFKVDLSAPGCAVRDGYEVSGIVSLNSKKCGAVADKYCSSRIAAQGYSLKQGTSMSAPHAAGMAAIAWTASPEATPLQIRQALLRAANPVQAGKRNFDFGAGKLSATNLIQEAQTAPGIKITSPMYGSTGTTFNFKLRIEARDHNVNWVLRYQSGPLPDDLDLSAGTAIGTGGTVFAGNMADFNETWSPAAGEYAIILEATSNGEKYYDLTVVENP